MTLPILWSRHLSKALFVFILAALLMGCGRISELRSAREERDASASVEPIVVDSSSEETSDVAEETADSNRQARPGSGSPASQGFEFVQANHDALLAAALDISVDELLTARQNALETAVTQAVAAGQLTQEQATALLERGDGESPSSGRPGNDTIDYQSPLAAELGISVEELRSAEESAWTTALAQAVADGHLTQADADRFAARMLNQP